jgi:cytochrome c oxidase subunit 1
MSDHHDHGHGHDDHHAPPSSFWRKYVFSTDHKVIGLQFTFTSLLFVILGGLLALGLRYELAWPGQNVPHKRILPNEMTAEAPEANIGHWQLGEVVELKQALTHDGREIPAGAMVTLTGFPEGVAVTIPAGVQVEPQNAQAYILQQPIDGWIAFAAVMGDYNYKRQDVRTIPGRQVVAATADGKPGMTLTLRGREILRPSETGRELREIDTRSPLLLPTRSGATAVGIDVPRIVYDRAGKELAKFDAAFAAVVPSAQAGVNYIKDTLKPEAYLQLFTMHASIMIFLVIIPMLVGGFGNFLIPLMIGARDMAFPKINALAFWLAVPAGLLMLVSFWTMQGPASGGWTMYPTLSGIKYTPAVGTTLWLLAVFIAGFSSITGALNYITTIINMRAPGMSMFRMPLTVWSLFITSCLALFATPVLAAAVTMLIFDRLPWESMRTMFFVPGEGGQPLMWQHLFWFYSHPAVYIMILPAMGVTSDILSTFARKPIFGYKPMVFAMAAITGLGFIVWGHHMFQSGMNPVLGTTFMASTIMIAVPSAIKTFNWLGTLWGGNIQFTPAMLNALGFVSMFVIGGLSGIFMASAPVDIYIHDTYFIVAHIHYVLFGGSLFGIFAGIYYWYPKMFGRQLNQKWGTIHFVLTIIAFNCTFFLMHILGIGGHPRRYASIFEYPTLVHLQPMNVFMTLAAMSLGMAQIPFFYNFFANLPRKLSRAIVALFAVLLGAPIIIGVTYYGRWESYGTILAPLFNAMSVAPVDGRIPFWPALTWALFAGVIFAAITVAVVFAVWWLGGMLRMPAILQRVLYVITLPAFVAPFLIKKDAFMWLGVPEWHSAWPLLMLLTALPGLAYLVIARPRDEFGVEAGDNPWHANSLEWATTSPPPFINFPAIPVVYRGPYEYSSPVVEKDYLPQPEVLPVGVIEPSGH